MQAPPDKDCPQPADQARPAGKGPLSQSFVMDNIVEAMSDGVVVVAPDGEIVLVNHSLCEILGLESGEMLGKGWVEVFFEDETNEDLNQAVVEAIQSNQPDYNRQVSYTDPQGHHRELITTISLIKEDGRVLGLVVLVKDVSELTSLHRRASQLLARSLNLYEEKVESLDRIARAVAHEVRNPVTAIGGLAARLTKMHAGDQRTHAYLERILEATGRLEQIVAQVRAYSYVPRPSLRGVEVMDWVKKITAPYYQRAAGQGVGVTLNTKAHGPTQAYLDPHLMATALNNLLDNALDAMPQGGELKVEVELDEDGLKITVADTGGGIAQEDLPYLFDPFFTTKADRVGMSLAITKRIISEHQGRLEVSSPEEGGTVIIVNMPRGEAEEVQGARAPQLK